jgi:hypothetical protein
MSPEQTPTLEFEREKWRDDYELRKREVAVKEQEASRSRWSSPLVLAVSAAAIGAFGNLVLAWMNERAQLELEATKAEQANSLEESKAEAMRILEMIRTGNPDKAAENLKFLVDAGLISNPVRRTNIQTFLAKREAGQGPVLPAARSITPEELNREVETLIPNVATRRWLSREVLEEVVKAATPEEQQQILERELQRNGARRLGLPPEALEDWENAKTPKEKEQILARER